jgi:UDP-N-acetylglucosamine 4-epimerase
MIYAGLRDHLGNPKMLVGREAARYADFRVGDVRHSNADVSKPVRRSGFSVTDDISAGMAKTASGYVSRANTATRDGSS